MATQSTFKNMSLCLLVICLVCSALLAGIYVLTEKPIADAAQAKLEKAISEVSPEFESMSEMKTVTVTLDGAEKELSYYELSRGGEIVAYAINSSATGFGGAVKLMVGITPDGTIYNTSVVDCSNETPGLGAKCTEPAFHDQFNGWNPSEKKLSVRKDGGDVDAITAATITSRGYTAAVSAAVEAFKAINDDGGQENE